MDPNPQIFVIFFTAYNFCINLMIQCLIFSILKLFLDSDLSFRPDPDPTKKPDSTKKPDPQPYSAPR